ncbi:hypothetical protein CDL60_07430 [Roseateles noduli]|nr:hypothetical protein CDL60_07430 [Roseateles noduli]
MSVQMPLTHLPDLALKQLVDAARVFKEFVRNERALDALGGSMFWKSVGEYEYLVQRTGRRLHYLGRRSALTEQQLGNFQKERERLRARCASLAAAVDVAQRMNKAVRIRGVATSVVEVLRQLAVSGLADRTLLLGATAVQAYAQSAGLAVDADPQTLFLLIDLPIADASACAAKIEAAVSKWARLSGASFDATAGLLVTLEPVEATSSKMKPHRRELEPIAPLLAQQLRVLREAPPFEHVLIARTGKMARVRAADPVAFELVARIQCSASQPIMEEMLRQSMLVSSWSDQQCEQANQQLQGIEPVPGLAIA